MLGDVPQTWDEVWALEPGVYSWVQLIPFEWQPEDTPSGALRVELSVHTSAPDVPGGTRSAMLSYIDGAATRARYIGERTSSGDHWAKLATATPPQVFDLPLADGFADNGGACYCKTQEGIVYVNAVLKSDTTREATSVGCVVGTLPAGFRPPNSVFTATLFDTGDMGGRILGRLAVRTNGQIVVANVTSSWDRCFGYIVFVAAS